MTKGPGSEADRHADLPYQKEITMEIPALKKYYKEQVIPELMKSRGYRNPHEVPTVERVVINTGVGAEDKNVVQEIADHLSKLAGQKAVVTKARVSISNFKLRAGMPIGAKVDLRGRAMWNFVYRLMHIALPAIRDFRGVPAKFDGNGNYTLGITDITIFPEINMDQLKRATGMDIVFVTTAKTDAEGYELLNLLGMPFRKPVSSSTTAEPKTAVST